MKVGRLKKFLEKCPDDFDVIISSDSEGNCYSPLADLWMGFYQPTSPYDGDFTDEENIEITMDDPVKNNAVCLSPMN